MNQTIAHQHLTNPTPHDFFILDIDSTLVSTHQRNQSILALFTNNFSEQFPETTEKLKSSRCEAGDYGLHSVCERAGLNVEDTEAKSSLMDFWYQEFFSHKHLGADQPNPGAVAWVKSLAERKASFVYLTARPKPTMWEGTLESLQALGFPISEENLFLKPDPKTPDADYKVETMKHIINKFAQKHNWLIDNEPVVLQAIDKVFPEVNLIFYDSIHSGRAEPPARVHTIQNFIFR